MTNMKTYNHFS